MSEILTITLGNLIATLGDLESPTALEEYVAALRNKLQRVKDRVEALEQENARLLKRLCERKHQHAQQESAAQFVEARGALFKRLAWGGYEETISCPVCHRTMWCFHNAFLYECSDPSCGHKADFSGAELNAVRSSLPHSQVQAAPD